MTDKGAGLRSLAFYGVARCRRVGFLFGKTISIELGDHNAVADANETPADLVLISPKFETLSWRFQPAKYQRALSHKGVDDEQA